MVSGTHLVTWYSRVFVSVRYFVTLTVRLFCSGTIFVTV